MKCVITYKVLVGYEVNADTLDEAIDKANELFRADNRFDYGELYCADWYNDDDEWVDDDILSCYIVA